MNIILKDIDKVDLSHLFKYVDKLHITYFSSKTYYKLINYISNKYKNELLLDIGTNTGASALCMSGQNKVISFDIINKRKFYSNELNVEYNLINCDEIDSSTLNKAKFIFLDINHDGISELKFYEKLKTVKFNGVLMLDDIHLTKYGNMPKFWASIEHKKYDLGKEFHHSGIGLVDFSNNFTLIK